MRPAANSIFVALGMAVASPCFATSDPLVARASKAKSDIAVLVAQTHMMMLHTNHVPNAEEWPQVLVTSSGDVENWKGPYLKRIPVDPWGNSYIYRRNDAAVTLDTAFSVYSAGLNGIDDLGGNDDISSWAGFDDQIYSRNIKRRSVIALGAVLAVVLAALALGGRRLRQEFRSTSIGGPIFSIIVLFLGLAPIWDTFPTGLFGGLLALVLTVGFFVPVAFIGEPGISALVVGFVLHFGLWWSVYIVATKIINQLRGNASTDIQ